MKMLITTMILMLACLYVFSDKVATAQDVQDVAIISASSHSPSSVETGYIASTTVNQTSSAQLREFWIDNLKPNFTQYTGKAIRLHNKDDPFAIGLRETNLKMRLPLPVARE